MTVIKQSYSPPTYLIEFNMAFRVIGFVFKDCIFVSAEYVWIFYCYNPQCRYWCCKRSCIFGNIYNSIFDIYCTVQLNHCLQCKDWYRPASVSHVILTIVLLVCINDVCSNAFISLFCCFPISFNDTAVT